MMLNISFYAYLLSVYLGEVSVQTFLPIFAHLIVFLLSSFKSALYILYKRPLCFANNFSQYVSLCPELVPSGGFLVSLTSRMKPRTFAASVIALKGGVNPKSEQQQDLL